jgi:hypothetical protein
MSMKTKNCLKNFAYRDDSIDNLLPETQPDLKGKVTVHTLGKSMTFIEMAQEFIGSTNVEEIKKHTLSLPMVEKMIAEREDELENTGWGNFAFVENADGSVSVLHFVLFDGRWSAYVNRLGCGDGWLAENRLLLRNSDASETLYLEERVARLEKLFDVLKNI